MHYLHILEGESGRFSQFSDFAGTAVLKCTAEYLINEFYVLDCGDRQKLIKKRQTSYELSVYYANIKATFGTIKK